jgi:hypothetical protein
VLLKENSQDGEHDGSVCLDMTCCLNSDVNALGVVCDRSLSNRSDRLEIEIEMMLFREADVTTKWLCYAT